MSNTTSKFVELIKGLFPKGRLWTFPPGSTLLALIEGVAVEFVRIADRADDVLMESDPRTTDELLEDWEECFGLPGDCGELATTLQDRRTQLVSKITDVRNQNKQLYVDIANRLGYDIDVDDVQEYNQFRVGDRVSSELASGVAWQHTFSVHSPEFTERLFRVNENAVSDRLADFGDDLLECLIEDAKPAHSIVFFEYG